VGSAFFHHQTPPDTTRPEPMAKRQEQQEQQTGYAPRWTAGAGAYREQKGVI